MQGFDMFRAYRVFSLLRPARPRHPIVQALFALLAVCAFVVLLVVGLAIAVFALIAGALLRAFGPSRPVSVVGNIGTRPPPDAPTASSDIIDGEFSVVDKTLPHGTR
jgi:hypothetical protein